MKSFYHKFLFIVCTVILISCKEEEENYIKIEESLFQALEAADIENFKDKDYILLVPRLGCLGCISSTESFMIEIAPQTVKSVGLF